MIEARFTAVLSEQRFDFPAQFRIGARQKRRTLVSPELQLTALPWLVWDSAKRKKPCEGWNS
jgi:hypothetical protein